MSLRNFHPRSVRVLLALMLFAWLIGAQWHGAMQIGLALGEEVCTAEGAKYVSRGGSDDAPAQPGKSGNRSCPLCAASGAPGAANAVAAADGRFSAIDAVALPENQGAVRPASHLADLASRAPPRA